MLVTKTIVQSDQKPPSYFAQHNNYVVLVPSAHVQKVGSESSRLNKPNLVGKTMEGTVLEISSAR